MKELLIEPSDVVSPEAGKDWLARCLRELGAELSGGLIEPRFRGTVDSLMVVWSRYKVFLAESPGAIARVWVTEDLRVSALYGKKL